LKETRPHVCRTSANGMALPNNHINRTAASAA
jgi:hypothetical protein